MIQFIFNQEICEIEGELTVFDFLSEEGVLEKWVAIIIDEEPITIDDSKSISIKDKMKIDIVRFVGGG